MSDAPDYPIAEVISKPPSGFLTRLESKQQEKHGRVYTLTGNVRIDYQEYTLTADKVSYNDETKNAEADGHVRLQGKRNNELILADHGTMNFDLDTGRFYNVTGSIGRQPQTATPHRKPIYTTNNPFLFTGRLLIKQGPERYEIVHGTMTSCLLPDPDWLIHASLIRVNYGEAEAKNSYFTLLRLPLLYLPYVTHPLDTESRASGLLIPVASHSSTKGIIAGESAYWAINRSADLALGTQYFSKRGWSPNGEFRYRGRGEDFVNARFTALWDRGLAPTYINQGGQDIVFSGRRDFDLEEHTRAVATGEYLNSYIYREAFAESFALAVASQVTSSAFVTHNDNGRSASIRFERYQNFEGVTQVGNTYDTPQIRILHVPSLDFDTVDQSLQDTPLRWGVDGSVAGLSRSEPAYKPANVASSEPHPRLALPANPAYKTGTIGRFDLYPHLVLPLHLDGWTLRPEVGARETFYSQSQVPTGNLPLVDAATVNRSDLEAGFELRPPALVRDFQTPALERLFGSDLRHTIEPELHYRYVAGVNHFSSVPRFDATDVVSDTNEVEYSLTQRLFFKHLRPKPCSSGDLPPPADGIIHVPPAYAECGGDTSEWITWKLTAKHFFDPSFGGAVLPFQRNVLISSLDLTGVSFLNGPLNDSPLISRLKVRTDEHTDFEWDADYDFKARRLDASNIFANYRRDSFFGSIAYSSLQTLNANLSAALAGQVTKYNLVRLLFGYGDPIKRGFSADVNAGYDLVQSALQYGGIQVAYNSNCCGVTVEFRRLALGSVRNENECCAVTFALAGVGSAGSQYFKRAEQIF